ncbi:MAG: gliding motility-associated C-terminal domain-containing protein [Bacteroidales bacterium]|jgi:gliding motility-associated-like protein
MSNIDNIFSKLKDHQTQSPDIWAKLEDKLNNNPTNGLENNLDKASAVKTTTSAILKIVGVVAGCGVIGVGTYLYLNKNNNEKELSKNKIEVQKDVNNAINISENKSNSNNKTISIEQINNNKIIIAPKAEDVLVEYNVNDEQKSTIQNTTSLIQPINTTQISETTIAPKNIQQNNVKTIVEEIKSPCQTSQKIKIPNTMTPNGDGINDLFEIKNIEQYPDNYLVISDRGRKIIYRSKGYRNNFDAKNIPQGTYFYRLEYNDLGKKEIRTGSITILRN